MTKKISDRFLIIASIAFFYLNDLFYLNNISSTIFYVTDYIFKSIILILIILSFTDTKNDIISMIKGKSKGLEIIIWTIGLIIIGVLIDQKLWRIMYQILPKTNWSISYPQITNSIHYWFDLLFGLIIVAIVEEYIFRKLIPGKLKFIKSKILIVILSSLIFGFAHWGFGPHAIVTTSIWALLPIISVMRTGSLLPAIMAHFLTNVIAFSGILNQYFN
jgi:membrane protease YdiL (CAAX protease family)